MLMRKLLTAALSVLLVTFALTPTALATEETSATPESVCPFSMFTSTRQVLR